MIAHGVLRSAFLQVMLYVTFKRHMPAIERGLGAEATQLLQQVTREGRVRVVLFMLKSCGW
jgi:hypothetical protein